MRVVEVGGGGGRSEVRVKQQTVRRVAYMYDRKGHGSRVKKG